MKNTDYLEHVLSDLFKNMESPSFFIPLVFANTIICYKLTFYEKSYWLEFSHWVLNSALKLKDFDDIVLFFEGFVKQNPQFEYLYNDTIFRLKEYNIFFEDFIIKQKYYYKNPDILEKHMELFVVNTPDEDMFRLGKKILSIAGDIKYKKTES